MNKLKSAAFTVSILVSMSCSMNGAGKEAAMKDGKVLKTEAEWTKELTPEEYYILRKKGTERAFTGKYHDHKEKGIYKCAGCGQPLFSSTTKFNSGTGWPSYWQPVSTEAVDEKVDRSLGRTRTEVVCSKCDGHLGHVFPDGPDPTGLRYCINSGALDFGSIQKATFGAGCFWCTEAVFELMDGVADVEVGYMGGTKEEAKYKTVCSGKTGHAEVSQLTYDPAKVKYEDLLEVFWKVHDPTTLNRQGNDVGPQYRSVIFYHTEEQKKAAEQSIKDHQKKLKDPIVTQLVPAIDFFKAEVSHQDYFRNNPNVPYCRYVIAPKVKKIAK